MTDHEHDRDRYRRLPPLVDPADLTVDVPVTQDDRPAPVLPPAGAPELVAATQVADGNVAPRTIVRPGRRAGAVVIGVAVGLVVVPAIVVQLFS